MKCHWYASPKKEVAQLFSRLLSITQIVIGKCCEPWPTITSALVWISIFNMPLFLCLAAASSGSACASSVMAPSPSSSTIWRNLWDLYVLHIAIVCHLHPSVGYSHVACRCSHQRESEGVWYPHPFKLLSRKVLPAVPRVRALKGMGTQEVIFCACFKQHLSHLGALRMDDSPLCGLVTVRSSLYIKGRACLDKHQQKFHTSQILPVWLQTVRVAISAGTYSPPAILTFNISLIKISHFFRGQVCRCVKRYSVEISC